MTGVIATLPKFQFSSSTGVPLALGTLTVYLAGTTTPTDTWQDSALSALNTNPVQLDSSGSCVLWLDSTKSYKFILKNAAGAIQWTQDNISGADAHLRGDLAASSGSSLVGYLPAGTGAVSTTVQAQLDAISGFEIHVKDAPFYAKGDGVTDDAAAIQAAYDYANTISSVVGNTVVVFDNAASAYKCNTGITMYPNKVATRGNGATLDFTSMTAGYSLAFIQTLTDAGSRNSANKSHPICSLFFVGPTGSFPVTCIKAVDQNPLAGPNYWLSGVTFNSCTFVNFYRDIEFGSGSFLFTFSYCNFSMTGGVGYDVSIYQPSGGTNYGENNEFIGCYWGKGIGGLIAQANVNATTYFRGCSADYVPNVFQVNGGYVEWDGYIESSFDSDWWGKVSGTNSYLRVAGQVTVAANKSLFELFYSDSTATNGGVDLDISIQISGVVTYAPPSRNIVGGTGRVRCVLRAHSQATVHPAIGGGLNFLANGGFESAALTDWTLSGAVTPPYRSGANFHSGAASLAFNGTTTNTPGAVRSFPCQPGQFLTGGAWYLVPAITGTSGTFYATVTYKDAGGTALRQRAFIVVGTLGPNVLAWEYAQISDSEPAPVGTSTAEIGISLFGTLSGAPIGYIDDITVAVV